jgi:hypothetical protein
MNSNGFPPDTLTQATLKAWKPALLMLELAHRLREMGGPASRCSLRSARSAWWRKYLGSLATTTAAERSTPGSGGGRATLALTIAGAVTTAAVVVFVTRAARLALEAGLRGPAAAKC